MTQEGEANSYTVSVGGKSARIDRHDRNGCRSYRVRYWRDGQRMELTAPSLAEARTRAKKALKHHESGAGHVVDLTPKQSAAVSAAVEKLREVNVPLLEAVSDFVAAKRIIGDDVSLAEAARGYVQMREEESRRAPKSKPVLFRDAAAKFNERNESLGLSNFYKRDCRKHLTRIGQTLGGTVIQNLRQRDLADCLEKCHGGGPRAFNNMRGTLNALFSFCQREGILPRERIHEAALIEKKLLRGSSHITIYTPAEMRLIVNLIGPYALPWVLLSGFAGLRSLEVWRIGWEAIRLDADVIVLGKEFTKTNRRRVIPMTSQLKRWIKPMHQGSGRIYDCPLQTFEYRMRSAWDKIKKPGSDKLLVPKRNNALRHSFGTYRFSILKDEFKVSAEMGNSPAQLREHYAELCLPNDAKAWFAIAPGSGKEVKQRLTWQWGSEKGKKRKRWHQ